MTVLSFVSLGYVWQLLGREPFAPPRPQTLSSLKKSIFNYLLFTLYHFQWYLRITTFPGVWIEFSCMFSFPWKYIWNGTWVVSFFHLLSFSSYPVFSLFLLFGISRVTFSMVFEKAIWCFFTSFRFRPDIFSQASQGRVLQPFWAKGLVPSVGRYTGALHKN